MSLTSQTSSTVFATATSILKLKRSDEDIGQSIQEWTK